MQKAEYYKHFDKPSTITDRRLLRILDFYLFNCPVDGVSFRGKKFSDYGFKGNTAFSSLKKQLLKDASPSLSNNYKPCKKSELNNAYSSIEGVSPPDEYCVFLKNDERRVMHSLFAAIRNSFAHGSYNVKSYSGIRIYFLINFKNYKKAQIVLQEDTLLRWIETVSSGYETLKREERL